MTTWSARVGAGADDGSRWNTGFGASSTTLTCGDFDASTYEYATFCRFTNVTVPAGATITSATLQIRARFLNGTIPPTVIKGEAADNPSAPTTQGQMDGRTRTSASVNWTPPAWVNGTDYVSADIAAVIQEIVDRGGWASGNALILFWEDGTGAGYNGAQKLIEGGSYNFSSATAPLLTIDYATASFDDFTASVTEDDDVTVTLEYDYDLTVTATEDDDVTAALWGFYADLSATVTEDDDVTAGLFTATWTDLSATVTEDDDVTASLSLGTADDFAATVTEDDTVTVSLSYTHTFDADPDPTETEVLGQGVSLRIYHRDDWDTPISKVFTASHVKWLDPFLIDGPGYGEFTLSAGDRLFNNGGFALGEFLQGNVVACYLDGVRRFTFRITDIDYVSVTDSEDGGASLRFTGPGLGAVLAHGVVMSEERARDPEHRIARLAPDERAFTFAADQYDSSDWPDADNSAAFGVRETQTVTITGSPTGGTFTVTHDGEETDPIAFDATVKQFRLALEDLSNLDPEDFSAGGSTGAWQVIFAAHLGDVDEMTADGSGLTGGTSPDATVSTTTAGAEASAPEAWPDNGLDWWVSAPSQGQSDPDDDDNPDVGLHYFTKQFTLASVKRVSVFAACRGECEIFIDGSPVLTAEGVEQTSSTDVRLFAGVHQVAVRYRPDTDSDARLAVSIGDRTGTTNGVPVYDWLLRTDDTWKAQSDVFPPPGFTPGRVLRRLIIEARERAAAVGLPSRLEQVRLNFTDTEDTNGDPYDEMVDRYWANGTDILSIAQELAESSVEVYMSPHGRLKVYSGERGTDHTTGDGQVFLRPGVNVTSMSHNRRIGEANHILYRYAGGWGQVHRNATIAGMREGFLSLGTADTVAEARRIVRQALSLHASFTEVTTMEMVDTEGARPYRDFRVGDWVWAPWMYSGVGSGLDPQPGEDFFRRMRVIALGVEADEDRVTFAPQLHWSNEDD